MRRGAVASYAGRAVNPPKVNSLFVCLGSAQPPVVLYAGLLVLRAELLGDNANQSLGDFDVPDPNPLLEYLDVTEVVAPAIRMTFDFVS